MSRLGETEELIAARARAEELREELRRAQSAQKDVELEADDLKAKIAPQETKLYSGAIKNPKELKDLQADIDQLKRHLSAVEDRDLEALSAVEAAESEARAAAAELAAMEAAWREEQAELTRADRPARRGDRRVRAGAGRDGRRRRPGAVADLRPAAKAHQGRGVAKLDRNLCLGCRISLPTSIVNRARAGSTLVQCPNCERILVAYD